MYILLKCYHIHLIHPFFKSLRKELTKMPKLCFQDLGFRNSLLNQWQYPDQRLDKGQNIENFLFIRLRQLYGMDSLRYWKTSGGNEIDFIVTPNTGGDFAMESKFKADSLNPSKYKIFTNAYPEIPLRLVAYSFTIFPTLTLRSSITLMM